MPHGFSLTALGVVVPGNLKNGAEDIKKHKWYRGLNWAALYNKQMQAFIVPDVQSNDDTSQYDKYADSVEESGPLLNAAKDAEVLAHATHNTPKTAHPHTPAPHLRDSGRPDSRQLFGGF